MLPASTAGGATSGQRYMQQQSRAGCATVQQEWLLFAGHCEAMDGGSGAARWVACLRGG